MTAPDKKPTIQAHQVHKKDTGSSGVQVALLTERINHLSGHVKANPKDNATRRGMLQMVSQRTSLLRYLSRTEPKRHGALIEKLGLRK